MVKRRLSQVLGALRRGFAVDTYQGGFPIVQTVLSVDAATVDAVHAAITLTTAAQSVTTGITSPDVYRTVTVSGNQSDVYANIVIHGTDWADRVISETLLASGVTTAQSSQPFKTVTKIVLPVRTATGQTIVVGTGGKLGLYRPINATSDVVMVERMASGQTKFDKDTTTGTISVANGTIQPSGTLSADDSFKVHYLTTVF